MRFPTKALLRCIRRRPKGTELWLPILTAREAWQLTEFLDEIQEAIWMEYGLVISDYLDSRTDRSPWKPLHRPDATIPGDF